MNDHDYRHHEHDHRHHEHDRDCEHCGHDHGNDHDHHHESSLTVLIAGAILMTTGLVFEHIFIPPATYYTTLPVCLAAYIILGREVLMNSVRNIARGKVFDENFLMSIATVAAFCIGDFPEAVAVMLFYNIGEMFADVSSERSREQIIAAVDMRPDTVKLVSGEEIPAADAKAGDLLEICPGDRIPLDGVIVSGKGQIDTSAITGESVPVVVKEGDSVLSGCINMRGRMELKVTAVLEESMVSRILDSVENAAATKPQIDKFITRFAGVYTPIVVLLAVLAAIIPPLAFGASWTHWILTAVTFLVISCPCAMIISVPLAYFLGIGAASKQGILFKSGIAMEALSKIKIVAMDKTGTITKGVVEDDGLLEVDESASPSESFAEAFAKKTVSGDEPKADAASGIAGIRKLGLMAAMLTGDKWPRAKATADLVGIDEAGIRAELLPEDKLSALMDLREKYGRIMFVGDGINDAPVLAGADVGAAMGTGADAAIEAADIVFMNSNVEAIPQSISIAARTGRIAVENIILAMAIKVIVIALGIFGYANIWLAVFADTGASVLCILNSLRLMR